MFARLMVRRQWRLGDVKLAGRTGPGNRGPRGDELLPAGIRCLP